MRIPQLLRGVIYVPTSNERLSKEARGLPTRHRAGLAATPATVEACSLMTQAVDDAAAIRAAFVEPTNRGEGVILVRATSIEHRAQGNLQPEQV